MIGMKLTKSAETDLLDIWQYTFKKWGEDQADRYYDGLVLCCDAIQNQTASIKLIEGLSDNIFVHRCQQHYIFFIDKSMPMIIAILHGRMDFLARLKDRLGG